MEITVTVCNVCKTPGLPTQRYRIEREGAPSKIVDLCSDDAAPLEDVLTYAVEPSAATEAPTTDRAPSRRSSRRRKVVTLDQIEELKHTRSDGSG